ncbi:MAG TPA: deoxyribonuclease IV [Firmicutes bacterium]|nr:deoxyribonuclease IV [Bacillota bacterium]
MLPRIGAHLSLSRGGLGAAAERARELGADIFQYFPKNPRSYRPKAIDRAELGRQADRAGELGLPSVAHSPYVTNLSTLDERLARLTRDSIVNDLEIAEAYRSPYLVVHCGRYVGAGAAAGREAMIEAVRDILARYQGPCHLLLENTAGQGTELGQTLSELADLVAAINAGRDDERLGICFDTCHAFAAGILDFDELDAFVAEWQRTGMEKLVRVIHLNDSKFGFGSHKDRHEYLGKGQIGRENLTRFLTRPEFRRIPWLIETPVAAEEEYAEEIRVARELATMGGAKEGDQQDE